MRLLIFTFGILFIACTERKKVDTIELKTILNQYEYIDSTHMNHQILAIRSEPYEHRLYVHMYKRTADGYVLSAAFDSLASQWGDISPIFEDFNVDMLMDFRISCGTGARGSNVFYYIFLQDSSGHLVKVKGTDETPNIHYDSVNNSLTSVAYWAGTSFVDYEIIADSLVPLKGVDVYFKPPNWTIHKRYQYLKYGEQAVVGVDSVADDAEGLYSRN